jgi:hypothetical protein
MSKQPYDVVGWAYFAEHYSHAGILSELKAEGFDADAHEKNTVDALNAFFDSKGATGVPLEAQGNVSAESAVAMKQISDGAVFPETDDSEKYPQPVFSYQIEDWDESIIDRVTPGAAPDFVTWREAQL